MSFVVLLLLRLQGVSEKLGTLIEGESLFNDGSAIVIFDLFIGKTRASVPALRDTSKRFND